MKGYSDFQAAMAIEVRRGKELYFSSEGLLAALTEGLGDVSHAILQEGEERVFARCVQVAAMACRLALEGDPLFEGLREERDL